MPNATIASRHLIDPSKNRVTVIGPHSEDAGYTWVRFEDGTESAFPNDSITRGAVDELDVLTHRAAALVGEIAMATREGWSAHRIHELEDDRSTVLEELHGRAIAEDVERGIEGDGDVALGRLLEFGLLLDVNAPRTAIAIRVVRDRLHGRALDQWSRYLGLLAEGPVRAVSPHGKDCRCCGAGVGQWR